MTSIVTQAPNYSGEQTLVSWTVTNFGAPAWSGTQYWVDEVYFSPYPTLQIGRDPLEASVAYDNSQPLGAGATYTQSATFTLPQGIGGTAANPQTFYVYVITDVLGALTAGNRDNDGSRDFFTTVGYEDPTNNEGSTTMPVIYREPDLQVTNLIVPTTAPRSGDTIPVTWTVTNVGNRDTRVGYWIDRVYLSSDPSLSSDDTELGEIGHYSILPTGQSYTITLDVPLPYDIGGNFYILVFTDANEYGAIDVPGLSPDGSGAMGRVEEFQGEGNNITAAPLPITANPLPDLQVTTVTATGPDSTQPDHVYTGQTFTVSWTVTNHSTGAGDTPNDQSTWHDQIWLSRDTILDSSDTFLDDVQHTGGLGAGASYTMTDTLKAPQNLSGPWYVFVLTDPADCLIQPRGMVFEGNNENNNATPTTTPLLIDQPPPSDLHVDPITIPAVGHVRVVQCRSSWTVTNTGANPASGTWIDAAYLSPSPIWDYTDPVIGRMTFSGTIMPFSAGVVHRNPRRHFPPGHARPCTASSSAPISSRTSTSPATTTTRPLRQRRSRSPCRLCNLGVPLTTTLNTGEDLLYQVTVPQGDTLRVDLTTANASAANELFLRYNALPTGSTYDAAYQGTLQANQYAVIPSTTAGIYYVMVNGQSEPGAQTPVTLVANVLPFEISDVIPDEGGDSKYVTTTILGAQFDPQAIVKLVRPGIAEYEPVSYQVVDKTKIIAIFDFTNAPHGLYDVEVINPDGAVALAPYTYLVEQALPPDVSIALGGPRIVWAGGTALYGFSLSNTSNVNIPYIEYQYGTPKLGNNSEGASPVPYLGLTTAAQGSPNIANVPWTTVNPVAETSGQDLATGYAVDFADQSNTTVSFEVQTYPDGLPSRRGNPAGQHGVRLQHRRLGHAVDHGRILGAAGTVGCHPAHQYPRRPDGLVVFANPGGGPHELDRSLSGGADGCRHLAARGCASSGPTKP